MPGRHSRKWLYIESICSLCPPLTATLMAPPLDALLFVNVQFVTSKDEFTCAMQTKAMSTENTNHNKEGFVCIVMVLVTHCLCNPEIALQNGGFIKR